MSMLSLLVTMILSGSSALPSGWTDIADQDRVVVRYGASTPGGGADHATAGTDGPASEAFRRGPAYRCFDGDTATTVPGAVRVCPDGQTPVDHAQECAGDELVMEPLFRQTWTNGPDGTRTAVSGWEFVDDGACVGAADLVGEAEAAFRTLTIAPSPVVVQPRDGWTLVNVPTIT